MAALVGTVLVHDGDKAHWFGPSDQVPEWALRKMGTHCFEDGEHPLAGAPEPDIEPPAPPAVPAKAGPNSSKDAWAAYAQALEVDITACGTRDAIIAAVADAGHPVE